MIHHVFANRSNIGDWLSAKGIQHLLAPESVTEHLCDEPFVPETIDNLSTLGPDDLIVIGGGGLFMDYFTPFWQGFREIADRVPFCIWGVGYCDLKREPSRAPSDLLTQIIGASRLSVVRDELTRSYLAGHALEEPVPCPSIVAIGRPRQAGHGVLHVDNYTTAGANVYEAMERCARGFAEHTGRPYRKTNNRIPPGDEHAMDATADLYAESDIVLSSALHGCVIAAAMGRKIVAVSGDRKIESFMEAVNLADWVVDIEQVENVPHLLARAPEQPDCEAAVESAAEANRRVARQVLALAKRP